MPAAKRRIIDRWSSTGRFDAGMLARGWLSVSAVAGKNDSQPALDRTVYIEQFDEGVRLTSTDTYRLLTTWVPVVDEGTGEFIEPPGEPKANAKPHAVAVAIDQYGRGRGLLAHMLSMSGQEENTGLVATLQLNVPWQAPETPAGDLQFDGFHALAVDLEYPGKERLQLPVFEGEFPPTGALFAGFHEQRVVALAIRQDSFGLIAKAAKYFGDDTRIEIRFGGAEKPMQVCFGTEPVVRGLVCPMKWDFDKNAPAEPVEP